MKYVLICYAIVRTVKKIWEIKFPNFSDFLTALVGTPAVLSDCNRLVCAAWRGVDHMVSLVVVCGGS